MEVGRIIGGKYRLRREIGSGGMGSVWAAVHEALDRNVAIKFLRPVGEDAETASARFVAEAKSAAKVKHRYVVDVFDFGITEDGVYYMVQELLEGEELADCIYHGPAWEVSDVVKFMADCLHGLEAVHQAGIVHRDLKPENIFVMRDSDGRYPKLLDFGISKMTDRELAKPASAKARPRQLTTQGTVVGTPWYMSPEQLRGRRDLDGRADLYSVGVILYEWLSGRVPYEEENVAELSLRIASGKAVPLISLRPELGHELSSVIAKALAPEPDERFDGAHKMREALLATLPSLPRAWSVVQKSFRANAAMGSKTETLLESAESPIADDLAPSDDFVKPRIRPWMFAVGALVLLTLLTLPFFLSARPERAAAVEEEATPASPTQQVEELPTKDANGDPAAPMAGDAPVPERPEPTTRGRANDVPQAPSESPDSASAVSESASKSRTSALKAPRGKTDKKVIRTLDF